MGRYESAQEVWVEDPTRGRVLSLHLRPVVWHDFPYVTHQVRQVDTMPLLADSMYGNARMYWLIAEMNPKVAHPDDLRYGELLNIPARAV